MPEVLWRGSHLKQFEFMEARHKRSNSDPVQKKVKKNKLNTIFEACSRPEMGRIEGTVEAKTQTPNTEVQNSLKQEILQLQERLQDQVVVRRALENALSHKPFTYDLTVENLIPKPAKELIKDIAVLELEVAYLEKYLLSLYRKNFDQRFSSLKTTDENFKSTSVTHEEMFPEVIQGHDIMSVKENLAIQPGVPVSSRYSMGNPPRECTDVWDTEKVLDSSIFRSHSSLSQRSAYSVTSPQKAVAKAVELYHSLPLSMFEQAQMDTSNGFTLAEHFGTSIPDHGAETPNWLSEEMIKSISAIYCELADPPLINHDYLYSPVSYSSSVDILSSQGQADMWSPEHRKFSSFNSHFDNPFTIGEPKEFSGPYCSMVKVQWIRRDNKKLQDIEHKLQNYRSLVYQLEEVDVRRMKHEEKLAFWINVHNSLVMHAYLVYGIPKNNLKRLSLLLKAAYNVGGHTISIDTIQSSILGCRLPRPGQWLRFLFPSKTKFKVGDPRRAYAIQSPEPLLHFALCSGSYSDPAVRIYTPKKVFQELEVAKEDYIQSNLCVSKEQKILLPKVMEYFAKDSDICSAGLLQMVEQFMPDSLRKNLQRSCNRKSGKSIEWISHNFAFRYLFLKELAQFI